MAQRNKPVVGLDIDLNGIAAAVVTVDGGIQVRKAAVQTLEPGILRDGEILDVAALSEVLRGFFRTNKGFDKRVRVGVANQKIVVRVLEIPPVSGDDLDAVVRFQAENELPMPLAQAVIDYQVLGTIDTDDGPRTRVLLVAARRDMVERVFDAVKGAGLRLEGIDLTAFALVRALYRPGSDDDHVLYLSVGGMTNLAVAEGPTCLFTRSSSAGLEGAAIDLAERCVLTLEHARGWLSHVGLEQDTAEIEGDEKIIAEARRSLSDAVRRIAAEVRNSLDYYAAQGHDASVRRVVLTGAAAAVPGFVDALSTALRLPVEVTTVEGAPDDVDAGSITIAAGLALTEVAA